MHSGNIVSAKNAEHYSWGINCDAWHLLKHDDLSVIEERMVPGSFERLHFHKKARQLFYILSGKADFEYNKKLVHLHTGESLHISPGTPHRILNNSDTDLHFLVISSPKSHGDRIDL